MIHLTVSVDTVCTIILSLPDMHSVSSLVHWISTDASLPAISHAESWDIPSLPGELFMHILSVMEDKASSSDSKLLSRSSRTMRMSSFC